MPRSTFSAGMFRNADQGMSRLAAALGGGGNAYDQAYQGELAGQSKIAQAMAAAAHANAQADTERAKAAVLTRRPGMYEEQAALGAGTDVPMVQAIRKFVATGERPQGPMGPPTEDGQYGVGGQQFDPAVQSKVAQQLMRLAPLLSDAGDMDPDKWAKMQSTYGDMDLRDKVVAGQAKPGVVGAAQAAMGGRPLFHVGENGAVLDQFGGGLDTSNPMAQQVIGLKREQAGQAKAGAAENYAQARAADATAGLRTKQAGAVGAGPGRVPVGYRYTSDPETGAVSLEPIPGGPKDPNAQTGKPLPGTAAKALLENSQNLRRAESALAMIEGKTVGGAKGDPDATGVKGYLPQALLNRFDKSGIETRAAIADLGSLVIHDRSGAAVTAAEYPRLAPFIPSASDDPGTVKKKLARFVQVYRDIVGESVDFYRGSGYNVPAEQLRAPVIDDAAPPAAPPARGGFKYLGTE